MDNVLKILDELKKDLASKQPNRLEITFPQDDTRLSFLKAKSLPEAPLKRLQIVHDIVKTVAYLHSVKILLKRPYCGQMGRVW